MDPLPQRVQPDSNPNAAPPPFIEDKQEIEIVPVQEGDDDFENVGDGDDEDDEFDDSESLLMDIVNEEIDDVFESEPLPRQLHSLLSEDDQLCL